MRNQKTSTTDPRIARAKREPLARENMNAIEHDRPSRAQSLQNLIATNSIVRYTHKIIMWFARKDTWPEIALSEIKKRARLLVIDDAEFPYESLFRRDGYTIEKWADVTDLPKLESSFYDIVLLDLQGVGRQQSVEQGLGVLRHLRGSAPAQLIIAYSSADWSLKYQEFFNLADAVLEKSADYVEFKRTVDRLLQQKFSLGFYIERVQAIVGQYVNEPDKVDGLVRKAVLNGSSNKLQKYLASKSTDPQVITKVLDVIKIAVGIAQLWKH